MRPLNIAEWPAPERRELTVDLIAKRLMHYRKAQGKGWKAWAVTEIAALTKEFRQR